MHLACGQILSYIIITSTAHENWRERSERSRIVLANFKWRERSIVPHDQNLHGYFISLLSAHQMII